MVKLISICAAFSTIFYSSLSRMNSVKTFNFFQNKVAVKKLNSGMQVAAMSGSSPDENVSLQLIFNVGSWLETPVEKGYAHLVEHMIFKGGKNFKETEIADLINTLGGKCNAFTSHDQTIFMINGPKKHAQDFLIILQKAVEGVGFLEEPLCSEMQVVIEELRLRNNDSGQTTTAMNELFKITFPDGHPYHDDLIGYVSVLAEANSEKLLNFYKKYYVANNATLFISGDVEVESFVEKAAEVFSNFKPGLELKKPSLLGHLGCYNPKSSPRIESIVSLAGQFQAFLSWPTNGYLKNKENVFISNIAISLLNQHLYKKLVNETKLATSVGMVPQNLALDGFVFLQLICAEENYQKAIDLIDREINNFIKNGILPENLSALIKGLKTQLQSSFAILPSAAAIWISDFIAFGEPERLIKMMDQFEQLITQEKIIKFIKSHLSGIRPNVVKIIPCNDENKKLYLDHQNKTLKEENLLLKRFVRTEKVGPSIVLDSVPENFDSFNLEMLVPDEGRNNCINIDGFEVLTCFKESNYSAIAHLNFKDSIYLASAKEALLLNLAIGMLIDVNSKFTREELICWCGSFGSNFSISSNGIWITSSKENFAAAISKCFETMKNPVFNQVELDKNKINMIGSLKAASGNPSSVSNEKLDEFFLGKYDQFVNNTDAQKFIENITLEEVVQVYNKFMNKACLQMIVGGNFNKDECILAIKESVADFDGIRPNLNYANFNKLNKKVKMRTPLSSAQVGITFKKLLPINFNDKEFAKILLLQEIIFGGGLAGKIMNLRNESGLFYSCAGNLLASVAGNENFKMATMAFLVAPGKEDVVLQKMNSFMNELAKNGFKQAELDIAKNNIFAQLNGIKDNFPTAMATALNGYREHGDSCIGLKSWNRIKNVTLNKLNSAFRKYLDLGTFSTCVAGRLTKNVSDHLKKELIPKKISWLGKIINFFKNKKE